MYEVEVKAYLRNREEVTKRLEELEKHFKTKKHFRLVD